MSVYQLGRCVYVFSNASGMEQNQYINVCVVFKCILSYCGLSKLLTKKHLMLEGKS